MAGGSRWSIRSIETRARVRASARGRQRSSRAPAASAAWTRGGREYHHIIDPRTGDSTRTPIVAVVAAAARRVVGRRHREGDHDRRRRRRFRARPQRPGVRAWMFLDDGRVRRGRTVITIVGAVELQAVVVRRPLVRTGRVGGRDREHRVGLGGLDAPHPAQGRAGVVPRPAQVPRNAVGGVRRRAPARAVGRQLRLLRSAASCSCRWPRRGGPARSRGASPRPISSSRSS